VSATRDLGDFGERVAAHRLESSGMTVLGRNIRVPAGEIDVLASEGADLVFVEVRTRRALPGAAAESITPVKLRRMWACAMQYCDTNNLDPERVRLDLVSIDLDRTGSISAFTHFRALEVPDDQ
jgi:putative endonuclease